MSAKEELMNLVLSLNPEELEKVAVLFNEFIDKEQKGGDHNEQNPRNR